VRAGLSPMDALLAATSRSAARLDREDEFGTIAPGLSADLVLLAADPLADIRNVRRIERVGARGRVYERPRLCPPPSRPRARTLRVLGKTLGRRRLTLAESLQQFIVAIEPSHVDIRPVD